MQPCHHNNFFKFKQKEAGAGKISTFSWSSISVHNPSLTVTLIVSCVFGPWGGKTQHFVLKLPLSTKFKFNRYFHCLIFVLGVGWGGSGNSILIVQRISQKRVDIMLKRSNWVMIKPKSPLKNICTLQNLNLNIVISTCFQANNRIVFFLKSIFPLFVFVKENTLLSR